MTRPPWADALLQKATTIRRCIARAREEHAAATDFGTDFTRQDAALMNVQRGCEAAIDMANLVVTHQGWGLPESAREAFGLLAEHGWIAVAQAEALQNMVGFRNIAVHAYTELDLDVVERVIQTEIDVLAQFAATLTTRVDSL